MLNHRGIKYIEIFYYSNNFKNFKYSRSKINAHINLLKWKIYFSYKMISVKLYNFKYLFVASTFDRRSNRSCSNISFLRQLVHVVDCYDGKYQTETKIDSHH